MGIIKAQILLVLVWLLDCLLSGFVSGALVTLSQQTLQVPTGAPFHRQERFNKQKPPSATRSEKLGLSLSAQENGKHPIRGSSSYASSAPVQARRTALERVCNLLGLEPNCSFRHRIIIPLPRLVRRPRLLPRAPPTPHGRLPPDDRMETDPLPSTGPSP